MMATFDASWFAGRLVATALAVACASNAQAQIVFDWGGDKASTSGKQTIKFNAPAKPGDIIVSFGDRRLYFITAPGIADSYPIAIPREQSRWEGVTSVSQKRENPSWTPTPTMLAENPRLPRWVPGGHPMNPLGNRALYLGSSAYRIHGTDAPWTIGTAASKGCVRLFNDDVADLYPRVKVGSKVTVTWQTYGQGGKGAEIATTSSKATRSTVSVASHNESESQTGFTSAALFSAPDQDEADSVAAVPAKAKASSDDKATRKTDTRKAPRAPREDARKAAVAGSDSDTETDQAAAAAPVEKPAIEKRSSEKKSKQFATPQKQRPAAKLESASIETGSIDGAAPRTAADRSAEDALTIAARAEAAASRAADAADRAAAAADRAIAKRSAQ